MAPLTPNHLPTSCDYLTLYNSDSASTHSLCLVALPETHRPPVIVSMVTCMVVMVMKPLEMVVGAL